MEIVSITGVIDPFLECRHVVLMPGVLDVSEQFRLFADEVQPTAKEIASRSHLLWVCLACGKHTATKQLADLLTIDPIVRYFPAVNSLHVECVTQNESDSKAGTQINDPVPHENAFYGEGEILPVRFDYPGECFRIGPKVL